MRSSESESLEHDKTRYGATSFFSSCFKAHDCSLCESSRRKIFGACRADLRHGQLAFELSIVALGITCAY